MSIHPRYLSTKRTLLFILSATLIWSSCGGKKSTTTTGVSVTISPTTASIAGGATQQFTATVTGSTNTAVTWQVNGENGGDALIGTVTSTGLYTAPTVLPSSTTVTVTAISQADTTKTAVAVVTLTAPAVTISIAPTSATLAAGAQQQFTPTITVTGSSNNAVNWSVNGVQGGDAIHGTIDANGLYTAPLSPPKAGITVTAQSQANTSFSASAPVTVQFGKASLTGTYVFFATRLSDSSGSGFAYRVGTFVADGSGNVTGGINDVSQGTAGALGSGSYMVNSDGRGQLSFSDDGGTHTFAFALTSNTRGQIIAFDSGPVISGFIRQQDQTAAATAPTGMYVFSMSGDSAGPAAAVGQLSFGANTGTEDLNTNGTVTPSVPLTITGLSVGAGGRGGLQLNGTGFVLYVIDASTLIVANTGAGASHLAGFAYAQSGTFSSSSLGTNAYAVSGATSGSAPKAYAQLGSFATNSAGSIASGTFDTNTAGGSAVNAPFGSSLTYSIASSGRGTFSNGTSNYIFWLASPQSTASGTQPGRAVLMSADNGGPVATGLLLQQQTGISSVTGGFALEASGTDTTGATAQAMDAQLTIANFGLASGTQDVNPPSGTPPAATHSFQNGSITISNALIERGTLSIPGTVSAPGANFSIYFVTADRFFVVSSGQGPILSGVAERQCSDCTF